ncbi:hypothetical protein D3C73_1475700 [compost metagenome]
MDSAILVLISLSTSQVRAYSAIGTPSAGMPRDVSNTCVVIRPVDAVVIMHLLPWS